MGEGGYIAGSQPWEAHREAIKKVVVKSGISKIGSMAFYSCDNLVSVSLPNTVTEIGSFAFSGCVSLAGISLPDGLTKIGNNTFNDCSSLKSVSIPDSVTEIDYGAFSGCASLAEITIPNSVTRIGSVAFLGCSSLESVVVPRSVKILESGVFVKCTSLKSVAILNDVGAIRDEMFFGCTSLTDVTIAEGIVSFCRGSFAGCTSLKTIKLPESTGSIDQGAFANCTSLTEIWLPRNVTWVGEDAFAGCKSLTSINIPATDGYIGSSAFADCTSLKSVYFTCNAPYINPDSFVGCDATAYYPKNDDTWTADVRQNYGGNLTWKNHSISPLKITKQPTSVKVYKNKPAKVTVEVEGDELQYRWYYAPESGPFQLTDSFTGNSYKVTMNSARNGRRVYCVITDKYGYSVRTDTVTLKMTAKKLTITKQPQSQAAADGEAVYVTVETLGELEKYKWYVKYPGERKFSKSLSTSGYAEIMSPRVSGMQVYCVLTDNKGNKIKTDTVTLSCITVTSQPTSDTAASNKRVSATVKATGEGLKYQWYIKNPGKTKFSKSSVTKRTYGYTMTKAKSGREAYCVITDKYGNSVKTDTIVFSRMYINTQPKDVTVANGKTARVTVKAVGEKLTYQWYIRNEGTSKFSKSSVTKATYSVKMSSKVDGREIYCVITDAYGNTIKTKTVTLNRK